jgi:crotonobetainyl-CoA:carnitine CoA-transferase CaiB-like acyl-CoA transferase
VGALDALVEGWTRTRGRDDVAALLQRAGLAAGPVLRVDELLDDAQLVARGLVIENDHPVGGRHRQLGVPWRADSVGVDYRRAPLFGEHTHEILTQLLGLTEDEYTQLENAGVFH